MKTFFGILGCIFSGMVLMTMAMLEYDEINDIVQYIRKER